MEGGERVIAVGPYGNFGKASKMSKKKPKIDHSLLVLREVKGLTEFRLCLMKVGLVDMDIPFERIDDASWDQEFVCYLAPYASELPAKQLKPLLEMKSFAEQDAEAEKNKEKERKKWAAGQKALETIKLSIKGDELGGLSDEDEEIQQEEPAPKGQPSPQGWVRRPPSYEPTEEELACGLWKIGTP
eukprot:g19372.t1